MSMSWFELRKKQIQNLSEGKDLNDGIVETQEEEKPEDTDFKQQRIAAWEPMLTPSVAIGVLATAGVVLLCIGFFIVYMSKDLHEEVIRYDDIIGCDVNSSTPCTISLSDTSLARTVWPGPIYVYYQLENFYQNHRIYVHSRSPKQLSGEFTYHQEQETGETAQRFPGCYPAECEEGTGIDTVPCQVMYPCGLVAQSNFSDVITMVDSKGGVVPFQDNDLAWPSDKELFHKPGGDQPVFNKGPFKGNLIDVTQDRFKIWMRVAGMPKFRKLYGRIDSLPKGDYSLKIANHFNTVEFKGRKYVIFATMGWLGGRNTFLSFSFLSGGTICLLIAVFFFLKDQQQKRIPGDLRLIPDYDVWKVDGKSNNMVAAAP